MTEINKIQLKGLVEPAKTKVNPTKEPSGEAFEAKLQQTLDQLESMGSELDAMIEGKGVQNPESVKNGVDQIGNMIQSMKGLVENIAPSKPQASNAKLALSKYEQNQGKDS